jgi:hypothetical protein
VSALVSRAIEAAGFGDVLAARREGRAGHDFASRFSGADLLVLGALADSIRREEVGDEVRVYTGDPSATAGLPPVTISRESGELTGLDLLRQVAVWRITGPRGVCIRVDWTTCGLELAQVALGFGANELSGRIANKRGLPVAAGELIGVGKKSRRELASLAKRKELAGFIERAGRVPTFVDAEGSEAGSGPPLSRESA